MYECMNAGLTIFEKLEKYSDADAAICLLTCDDMGKEKNEKRFKVYLKVEVKYGLFF